MATDPAYRGRGVGAAVLEALVAHARAGGGGVLWCNARVPAQRFYERAGLQTRGEPWEDPEIGPHVLMWRRL
jgi:ribosomal protein S18 acetylase RimI-like enzyme